MKTSPTRALVGAGATAVLMLAGSGGLDGLTTDVEAKVILRNGVAKKIRVKNLDIAEMVRKQQQ